MASQVNARAIIGMTRSDIRRIEYLSASYLKPTSFFFTDNNPILSVMSLIWGVKKASIIIIKP